MRWEERNNEYLADALAWLRTRLDALAGPPPAPAPPPKPLPPPPRPSFWARVFGSDPKPEPVVEEVRHHEHHEHRHPDTTPSPAVAALADAERHGDRPPAHVELAQRLNLSPFERDVLLLAVAAELDPGVPPPSFALALRLFDDPAWDALSPHGPLRRLHLVHVDATPGVVNGRLWADERVVNFVKGFDHLDERLSTLLAPMGTGEGAVGITPSQQPVVDAVQRRIEAATSGAVVVNLVGPQTMSKRLVAEQAAAAVNRYPLRVPVANLPAPGPELDAVARLWERDALLSPLAIYLDASDDVIDTPDSRQAVDRVLTRLRGLVFLDSREVWPSIDPGALVLDVPGPTTAEQRAAWSAVVGSSQEADRLAGQFDLDLLAVRTLAADNADDPDRLWGAALRSSRPRLDLLAQRVEPKAARADLVVPDEVGAQLDRILGQVRHRAAVHTDWGLADSTSRGLGITALFAGESGTGKTLAAEVLAHELDLNLYVIDLSAVVSKYIGETEKNLRRLFDAAERGGTILFFDEADALFGKRSEVRDSHDRYANIEVNYLLQRMEAYRGLAVLATNMKSALDRAFARRLRFVVDFPFPDQAQREAIWRRSFVPRVDTSAVDFPYLSKFALTGGSIRSVAVNATFGAAGSSEQRLTMPIVLSAARMEYRKLGLPLHEADFVWDPSRATVPELTGA